MTDVIGAAIAIFFMLFLISPLLLITYMLINSKIDVDGDGSNDAQLRWGPQICGGKNPVTSSYDTPWNL